MILIGIGSNLAAPGFASPRQTATVALSTLPAIGIAVVQHSRWYLTQPVPSSDQPWYVNAVAAVETELDPAALLVSLLAVETRFERRRGPPNAARTLDLDLLDYNGYQCTTERLVLPHPRLHERRFVLVPLCEIAPDWRHSRLGLTAAELLLRLPSGQSIRVLGDQP